MFSKSTGFCFRERLERNQWWVEVLAATFLNCWKVTAKAFLVRKATTERQLPCQQREISQRHLFFLKREKRFNYCCFAALASCRYLTLPGADWFWQRSSRKGCSSVHSSRSSDVTTFNWPETFDLCHIFSGLKSIFEGIFQFNRLLVYSKTKTQIDLCTFTVNHNVLQI